MQPALRLLIGNNKMREYKFSLPVLSLNFDGIFYLYRSGPGLIMEKQTKQSKWPQNTADGDTI